MLEKLQLLAERVGFEPTVRLPVQRFSSSVILVLARAVLWLGVCSSLPLGHRHRVEGLLKTFLGGFARVNCASHLSGRRSRRL
jgi:hypothetical protein